ncbi:MAG: tRNA dihydrouridine synthase DusB [Planctomycetes bacterium]|nr:tRNA dihydrouridine synthase DusB [Planctomycetota bacterium]
MVISVDEKTSVGTLLHPLRIGSLELRRNLLLSPICGVSNSAHRILCKEHGAALVFTEMTKAKMLGEENEKTLSLASYFPEEHPVGIQLGGGDPDDMEEGARIAEGMGFDIVDVNSGCPARKVTKQLEGVALMSDPALVGRIIERMVRAVSIPVTIKVRLGLTHESINAKEVARVAVSAGAKMVTIHGRTAQQGYSGTSDWERIAEIKAALCDAIVIGNGDVRSPEDAKSRMKQSGVDGVMIGRGSFGNPWIFDQIAHYLEHGTHLPGPTIDERRETLFRHYEILGQIYEERTQHIVMRRIASYYTQGLPFATSLRRFAQKIRLAEDVHFLANNFFTAEFVERPREVLAKAGVVPDETPEPCEDELATCS